MNKLSKREIMLIIILVNLIGYYLLFNVIGLSISNTNKSKLEAYEELKAQQDILEIESIKNQIDTQNLENLTKKNNEIKNQIFSTTNSENIHYFLNQVAKKSNIVISSINIKKVELGQEETQLSNEETTTETNIDITTETNINQQENKDSQVNNQIYMDIIDSTYNIELDIAGEYKDKLNFIKNIENYKKTMAITDFSTVFEDKSTTSKLKMTIYTINKENIDKEFVIK